MIEQRIADQTTLRAAAGSAMLLVQVAAAQAAVGPFARQGRETPQTATLRYRAASGLVPAAVRAHR